MAPIPARKPIERPTTLEAASLKSSRDPRRRPSRTPSVEPENNNDPPRAPSRASSTHEIPTESEHPSHAASPGEWDPFPDLSLEKLLDAREDLYESIDPKLITDNQESIETKRHGSVLAHDKLPDGTRLPLHYILDVLIEKRKAPTVPEAVMNDAEDNTTAEEQLKAQKRLEKPPPSPRSNHGPPPSTPTRAPRSPRGKSPTADPVPTGVLATGTMAKAQPKPNISFEETPRAKRTLPIELPPFDIDPDEAVASSSKEFAPPTFNPFEYFGMETPKKPAKKSKMRIESDADSDIVVLDDAAVAAADARQATKRLLDDLVATFAPDFVMKASDIGMVRILDNSRYRGHFSAPPAKRYLPTKNRDDGADLLASIINAGHSWIYVSVYGQPNPTEDDATHLAKALETLEKTNLTDVIVENYIPNALKKGGKGPNTLILACKTKEAEEAILRLTGLSYDLKETKRTFIFQDAQQWGNVVQITIGNAKDDMTDVLRTVAQKLHPFIAWDKNDKTDRWPTYLAIAPIPDAPVHQGGPQGRAQTTWVPFRQPGEPRNWRVAFAYDRTRINKLQIPEIAGQWAWGSVTMALTDFCQACCSWGHTTSQCGWWEVPGVQVRAKPPQNSNELDWTVVEALHPQTGQPLKREQKKQPSREPTPTPSLPEPPTKGKGKGRGRPRKSIGPPQPLHRK